MKRGKKLLVLLAVLVLLIGAVFAASRLTAGTDSDSDSEADAAFTLFTLDTGTVTAISWDYCGELSFSAGEDGWQYTADAAFPADETYLDNILTTLSSITAYKIIEGVEDLDQYGLEAPICAITVTAEETYTLAIGLETGISGQRYFSLGDGNVYLVDSSIVDCFTYRLYDMLLWETIPTMAGITALRVNGESQDYEITHSPDNSLSYSGEYVWLMGEQLLDPELAEALLCVVSGLTWEDCVEYNAADLSLYGLDVPIAQVEADYEDTSGTAGTFCLDIGTTDHATYYARLRDSGMVYTIDADTAVILTYTTYDELKPDDVLRMDLGSVDSVEITLDGVTYTVERTTQEETNETDGTVTEQTVYTLDGAEAKFGSILEGLNSMASTGYAYGITPERSVEISFLFHRNTEDYPTVELVFYRYDSTSCLVTLNGETTVFVSREDIVSLSEAVNAILLG